MPGTKINRRNTSKEEHGKEEAKLKYMLDCLHKTKKEMLDRLQEEKNKMLEKYRTLKNDENTSISHKYLNMTIKQIYEFTSFESTSSVSCLSKTELLNITKSTRKDRKILKRSASFMDDEGYLTAESVNSGGRKSRTTSKLGRPSNTSRSLSRTNLKKGSLKTPANKTTPPNSYGVVTPKCKPNTPQVILRRPKNGEVALSMQGSPLYTAAVVREDMANINIPLSDGRLLTLQPQRGLRVSQIPEFDPHTLRQLETLKENLDKVCKASEMKN